MTRMPWGASINPPGYLGLGAEVDPRALHIVAGPVPAADLNTPWTPGHYRRQAKTGTALRRRDFAALQKQGKRNSQRPIRGVGFGDASGLGFAPLVVAAAPKIASGIKKLTQKSDPQADAVRDARIASAESLAMVGNVAAAAYIWQITGHNGTKNVPAIPQINFVGGPVGPGASADSQYHARIAWQRIIKAIPTMVSSVGILTGSPMSANAPLATSSTVLQSTVASLPPRAQAAVRALTTGTAVDSALFSTPDIANTSGPGQAAVQNAQAVADGARPLQAGFGGVDPMTMLLIGAGAYLLLNRKR